VGDDRADTLEAAHLRIEDLERALAEREAAAAAAAAELESLSYGISHDLRSPLRAVGGFAQMLEEDCGPALGEDGRRYVEMIRAGAHKLDLLVDAMHAYSSVARQPLEPATVDMGELARRALQAALAGREGPAPQVQFGELPPADGDPQLLYHVWHNLLGNALRYTGRTAAPRIEIGGSRGTGEAVWFVRDNGAGFDMRYASKLFGMFQRLHPEKEFPGVGAGLAIARRIVVRHGGRIWAEAAPGRGACFQFSLPLAGLEPLLGREGVSPLRG
jgi:light-regulated signal transduction histidine kinase (bacteriophytochrome)